MRVLATILFVFSLFAAPAHATGLMVEDTAIGTGEIAEPGDLVTVHYTGWLIDGTKFDSSRDPGRRPLVFSLGAGQVMAGTKGSQGCASVAQGR